MMTEYGDLIQRRQGILNRLNELEAIERNQELFNAVITSMRQASEALKGSSEDLGKAKKGFEKLKQAHTFLEGFLGRFINEGKEVLSAAGKMTKGLNQAKKLQKEAADGLATLANAMAAIQRVMDDPENPAAIMQAFEAYFGAVIAVLKKLIGKIPGIGAFLGAYLQSIQIIRGDIEKLQKSKEQQTEAMRELFGAERYPLQLTESEERQNEIARLEAELETLEDEIRATDGFDAADLGEAGEAIEEIKERWHKDFESNISAALRVTGLDYASVSDMYTFWLRRQAETGEAWENWRGKYKVEYGITVDSPDQLEEQLTAKRDEVRAQVDDLKAKVRENPTDTALVDELGILSDTLDTLNLEVSNLTNEVRRGVALQRDFELADRALAEWSTPFVALQTFIRERILNDLAVGTLKWTPGQMKRFSQSTGIQISPQDVEQRQKAGVRNFAWPLAGAGCLAVACIGVVAVLFGGSLFSFNPLGVFGRAASILASDQALDGSTIVIDELHLPTDSCVVAYNDRDEIVGSRCFEAGDHIAIGIEYDRFLVTEQTKITVREDVRPEIVQGEVPLQESSLLSDQDPVSIDIQLSNLPQYLVIQNQTVRDGNFVIQHLRNNNQIRVLLTTEDGEPVGITQAFEGGVAYDDVRVTFPRIALHQAYSRGETNTSLGYAAMESAAVEPSLDGQFVLYQPSVIPETTDGTVEFDLASDALRVRPDIQAPGTQIDVTGSFFTETGVVRIFAFDDLMAATESEDLSLEEAVASLNQLFLNGNAPAPLAEAEVGAGPQTGPVPVTHTQGMEDQRAEAALDAIASSVFEESERRNNIWQQPNTPAVALYSPANGVPLFTQFPNIPNAVPLEITHHPFCPLDGIDGLRIDVVNPDNNVLQWTEFHNVTNTCEDQPDCSTVYRQTNANNTSRGTWDPATGRTVISGQFQFYDFILSCYENDEGEAVAEVGGATVYSGRDLRIQGVTLLGQVEMPPDPEMLNIMPLWCELLPSTTLSPAAQETPGQSELCLSDLLSEEPGRSDFEIQEQLHFR
jgi:DNA repair ATPase RecN